jgi:Na+/proline symporter/nitrogen-specific signal transduction histidine kinase|tara:strand:- start:3502 stop:6195 length:2694 start_codon:yes stop_codon:yes gene_type:complete
MPSTNLLFFASFLYVALLFLVAFLGDRRARRGKTGWIQSPVIYTLSISVYCTSWTFYGAVGSAARNGLEFVTIYLGPTLVFIGWWYLLRKLVRIGQVHRITSIADLISSRYGKSNSLAALVTVIAVVGTTPYIALQLKAVTASFEVMGGAVGSDFSGVLSEDQNFSTAFWVAVGMALFTILFGTRNIDANERHHGVVAAIALEAVVKLLALLAVGLFAVYGVADGPSDIFQRTSAEFLKVDEVFGPRWIALTFLSAAAIITLPRQFQVTVVENADERHLSTASWLFPLYLLLISLFILPIAIAGLTQLPAGSNPDMFVLTLPMSADQNALGVLAFLGGFSSATSMVIVASIALSTMVSNHLIMPIALRLPWLSLEGSGDVKRLLLYSRRISICVILALGFIYFRMSGKSDALASIGLISFAGVAQFLPSILGGLYWRHATGRGAFVGLCTGFLLWAYTLFLPSFGDSALLSSEIIANGLFGLSFLRPEALFGLEGVDPLVHSLFWSLTINSLLFIGVSMTRSPKPLEQLQSTLFVNIFRTPIDDELRYFQRSAATEDLFSLTQRILGADEAHKLFRKFARRQGMKGALPAATDAFISHLERRLAGAVGSGSARAMISQVASGETISLDELMRIADETAQLMEYSQQAEQKSRQLEITADQLRQANQRLKLLDLQKDDFLSLVSHEVRTPMTSIRSFSEALLENQDLSPEQRQRFHGIINEESLRLTRLLDEILDLNLLERGEVSLNVRTVKGEEILDRAINICQGLAQKSQVKVISGKRSRGASLQADADRLQQVFINLLTNAIKYNSSPDPRVTVQSFLRDGTFQVVITDNGPGIPTQDRELIFSKFARGWASTQPGGTGLGLAISHQIVERMNGKIELLSTPRAGAAFRVSLPLA